MIRINDERVWGEVEEAEPAGHEGEAVVAAAAGPGGGPPLLFLARASLSDAVRAVLRREVEASVLVGTPLVFGDEVTVFQLVGGRWRALERPDPVPEGDAVGPRMAL